MNPGAQLRSTPTPKNNNRRNFTQLESWTPVPLLLIAAILAAMAYAVPRIVRYIRSRRNRN